MSNESETPRSDLERWSDRLVTIVEDIRFAMDQRNNSELKTNALMNALVTADFLRNEIRRGLAREDPMHSSSGFLQHVKWREEDKPLLRAYVQAWLQREFGERK